MDVVNIYKISERQRGVQKGEVHYTNVSRLQLDSAVRYGKEFLTSFGVSGTSLTTDIARGVRALSPDKIDYVSRSTMAEIVDSIYNTIAYILECRRGK